MTRWIWLMPLLLFSVILLTTCENALLLLQQLDDQVMVANDRYLEVVETYPEQNDQDINPGIDILITFDRDVDPADAVNHVSLEYRDSIGDDYVFGDDPDESYTLDFSDKDNTLSIDADVYLKAGVKITVTLEEGLTAADGTKIREPQSWSFNTGRLPIGTIDIVDGLEDADIGYVNAAALDTLTGDVASIDFTWSYATYYAFSKDIADLDKAPGSIGWTSLVPASASIPLESLFPSLLTTDGEKTVYVRFRDEDFNVSPIFQDSTIIDRAPPVITPPPQINTRIPRNVPASFTDLSGARTYAWAQGGTPTYTATITNENTATARISGPANVEEEWEIELTITDRAGNTGSGSYDFRWDTLAPNPAPITTKPVSQQMVYRTTPDPAQWSWTDLSGVMDWAPPYVLYLNEVEIEVPDPKENYYVHEESVEWYPGYYRLAVRATDQLGNSRTESEYIEMIPPDFLTDDRVDERFFLPEYRQTEVSLFAYLSWGLPRDLVDEINGGGLGYYFDVYVRPRSEEKSTLIKGKLLTNYLPLEDLGKPEPRFEEPGELYYWYVEAYVEGIYEGKPYRLPEDGEYEFVTSEK